MLDLAQRLIDKGHAYESEGHVLFDVTSMDDYGLLSGRQLDDMLAGARVEVASYKRHPGDFVLWKPSSDDEPGWDSDYGRGRPGWHIECSAMIHKHSGITSISMVVVEISFSLITKTSAPKAVADTEEVCRYVDAQCLRRYGRREDVQVAG